MNSNNQKDRSPLDKKDLELLAAYLEHSCSPSIESLQVLNNAFEEREKIINEYGLYEEAEESIYITPERMRKITTTLEYYNKILSITQGGINNQK